MRLETVTDDIMISSFTLSPDDLVKCGIGVATAMQIKRPTPFPPVCVLNEYDDYFGNSVNIVFKYQQPIKRKC